jgi:peptidyl-prolyl cis-trans isomerase D
MLELMRKHAGSWIIKIILGALALAFALSFGVYSYYGSGREVALKVNGEPITVSQVREELGRLSEEARRQLGEQYQQLAPMLNLKDRAVNQLVDRALLFQTAQRLGVGVSQAELGRRIAQIEAFQKNGSFDLETYQRVLARNRLTPEGFEEIQRNDLVLQKLSILIAGAGQVTPLEVEQELVRRLTQVKGVYRLFAPESYLDQQKAGDQEMQDYYQKNRQSYLVPEKIQLRYVAFPLSAFRDRADVRQVDITDYYELHRDQYARPERVRASHILIKLDQNATESQVEIAKKLAESILEKARQPGADFAELARQHSQGPTAERGGDLGYFRRGQMVPAFEELAFRLEPGGMGLVRTRFGWHVVRVVDKESAQVTPLEEVAGEIRTQLTESQAKDLAAAAAERAFDKVVGGESLDSVAQGRGAKVHETPAFVKGQPVEGLPGLEGVAQAVEGLGRGQVAPVMTYEGGAVLAVVQRVIPETVKPLEEVREEVRLAVREQKADQAAKQAAAGLLAQLRDQAEPAEALAGREAARETGWLERDAKVPGLEHSTVLTARLFATPEAAPVLERPAPVGERWAAAVLAGRKEPTAQEKDQAREEVRAELLLAKRRQLVQSFLADLRDKAQIQMVAEQL